MMSVVFGACRSESVQRWIGAGRLDNRLVLRLLLASTQVTAFMSLAGWGCFSVGLAALIAGTHVRWSGSRVWRSTAVLAIGYTLVAQGFLLAGVTQSVLEPRHSHLVAVCVLAVALISAFHLGASDKRREQASLNLARTEHRFEALVRNSTDAIVVLDREGLLTYASPTVQHFNRQSAEELLGRRYLASVHPQDQTVFEKVFTGLIENGPAAYVQLDVRILHDGEWRWFEVVLHNLLHDPAVAGIVANHRDITQRRIDQEQLAYAATHDSLTGLANRTALRQRLEACLQPSAQTGTTVAVIDVDEFKPPSV
ncbi:PAS domain S-box protein [Actinoplanes xinjiangensis]|uniref:PAS domain S-box protein n=1 Tax=Actinoplanes xinjiangensis TaxID=512350 RepID=UPI00341486D3